MPKPDETPKPLSPKAQAAQDRVNEWRAQNEAAYMAMKARFTQLWKARKTVTDKDQLKAINAELADLKARGAQQAAEYRSRCNARRAADRE